MKTTFDFRTSVIEIDDYTKVIDILSLKHDLTMKIYPEHKWYISFMELITGPARIGTNGQFKRSDLILDLFEELI